MCISFGHFNLCVRVSVYFRGHKMMNEECMWKKKAAHTNQQPYLQKKKEKRKKNAHSLIYLSIEIRAKRERRSESA